MKITKLGHCCLLIETKGLRILTDPGTYSTLQNEQKNIDIVLITHEHSDHLHIDSLRRIVHNNPNMEIITNTACKEIILREHIEVTSIHLVEDGESISFKNVLFSGYGEKHAVIYPHWGEVQNIGYMIDGKLFYPGDAFTDPHIPIEILALPVAGPWMKISEAVDYALLLKPKKAFPVHDGILKVPGMPHRVPATFLPQSGIEFIPMSEGDSFEF